MTSVGELILRHQTEILHAWTEAAREAPSAKNLNPTELAGLMPEYLALLGQDGTEPDAPLSAVQQALIERHLSNRLRAGFNLSEIVTEFALLGRCVSRYLEADTERRGLYAELYQTATAVTQIFHEHLLEDEQTMKRYGRLLEHIANDPIGVPDRSVPLRDRLGEVLELILEAMGARTAVLLLRDAANERLAAVASLGAGAAELETVACSLEATTFAATMDEAGTEAAEVKSTPALRQRGVGSLLRIRLVARDTFCCVVYVGIEDERAFTASEVRRLEGLSGALTVHLDNAQLRAALRQKRHELRDERQLRERVVSVLIRDIRGPLAVARASARRLASDPVGRAAAAAELADTLGGVEKVVDAFLATTPAMPGHDAR